MDDRPERLLAISADELLALVELIYDAVTEGGSWAVFLRAASEAFGAGATSITLQHPGFDVNPILFTDSPDAAGVSDYAEHFYSVDPFRERLLTLPEGQAGLGEALIPDAELARTEIFNDWYRPNHLEAGSVAGMVVRHEGVPSVLSVYRRRGGRELGVADVALTRVLIPHLKRALQLQLRLGQAARSAWSLLGALDRLAFGVILVNSSLRALAVNRAASQLVAQRNGLLLHRGELRTQRSKETRRLHQLVGRAMEPGEGRAPGAGGALLVDRGRDRRPIEVLVAPLHVPGLPAILGSQVAAVFATDPDAIRPTSVPALRERYGFTTAEAEVASRVASGIRPEAVAADLGISPNTVRARLQEVFAKTGTHRQVELVQRLMQHPVWLRRDE